MIKLNDWKVYEEQKKGHSDSFLFRNFLQYRF